MNNLKKIKVLQKKVIMHHRFMMALENKDVPPFETIDKCLCLSKGVFHTLFIS